MEAPESTDGPVWAAARRIGLFVRRTAGFAARVIGGFRRNKGLLLAGALGYNGLLSIIPLVTVVLVVLSHVVDPTALEAALRTQLGVLLPHDQAVLDAFDAFQKNGAVLGWVGFAAMLFFSTIAFRMLEDAMSVIFHRPQPPHPLLTFALPLAYVGLIGLGILAITSAAIVLDALGTRGTWPALLGNPGFATLVVKLLAFVGLVVLSASFYKIMPFARVKMRRAIVGGLVAATLWEGVRALMVWYFANLSLVDVIYGSLATVVVILLALEVAAIILLLGAQVIAELERSAAAGLRWWEASR